MAALIPGLAVQVEGTYNGEKQLVAKSIKFSSDDLKNAKSVQAGMHETRERSVENAKQNEQQNAELASHKEELASQRKRWPRTNRPSTRPSPASASWTTTTSSTKPPSTSRMAR